jgi:hypothetical protein
MILSNSGYNVYDVKKKKEERKKKKKKKRNKGDRYK